MKLYSVKNPEDLANAFDRNSRNAENRAEATKLGRFARDKMMRESSVWREAAEMIRNMEFVGWSHDANH